MLDSVVLRQDRVSARAGARADGDRHDLRDLTVAVRFEGDYDDSYTMATTRDVLPTDTMKNTVYALAAHGGGRGARGVRPASRATTFSSATIA